MESAPDVAAAFTQFLSALSRGDEAVVSELASSSSAAALIGSAPEEWRTGTDTWDILPSFARTFHTTGLQVSPTEPIAYADEALGWVVDRPVFRAPTGVTTQTRMTALFHREADGWKLIHLHNSVGVPDADVAVFRALGAPAER
jgi:SnoaL-like protein